MRRNGYTDLRWRLPSAAAIVFRVLDPFDQHVDAVAAPEQFTVEDHGRDAEHAERLGFVDYTVVLFAGGTVA